MPPRFKWDPHTGTFELTEEPKPTPKPELPPQLVADYADAEKKTKAFLDGVHVKEARYLEAYDIMRKRYENARTPEERQRNERQFDEGHDNTVRYRNEEVRNRDTAIQNTWSAFSETWPQTTCKLKTATEKLSGKTYRTVEIESPYFGKRVIGPTKVPEARHLVDESRGGFRAQERPKGFLPQRYIGGPPAGSGHPPSASHLNSGFGSAYGAGGHDHHHHHHSLGGGLSGGLDHYHQFSGWGPPGGHDHHHHQSPLGSGPSGGHDQYHNHPPSGWGSSGGQDHHYNHPPMGSGPSGGHDHYHNHPPSEWGPSGGHDYHYHHHSSGWGPF